MPKLKTKCTNFIWHITLFFSLSFILKFSLCYFSSLRQALSESLLIFAWSFTAYIQKHFLFDFLDTCLCLMGIFHIQNTSTFKRKCLYRWWNSIYKMFTLLHLIHETETFDERFRENSFPFLSLQPWVSQATLVSSLSYQCTKNTFSLLSKLAVGQSLHSMWLKCAKHFHSTIALRANMLETIPSAERRLHKINNCTFQGHCQN